MSPIPVECAPSSVTPIHHTSFITLFKLTMLFSPLLMSKMICVCYGKICKLQKVYERKLTVPVIPAQIKGTFHAGGFPSSILGCASACLRPPCMPIIPSTSKCLPLPFPSPPPPAFSLPSLILPVNQFILNIVKVILSKNLHLPPG